MRPMCPGSRPDRRPRPAVRAVLAVLVTTATLAAAPGASRAQETQLTEDEKVLYFLGTMVGRSLQDRYFLEAEEIPVVSRGIADALGGKSMPLDERLYGTQLNELARERMANATEMEKAAGTAYLEKMASTKGAVRTESGLIFLELEKGDGARPDLSDTVTAHYHGTLRDGKVFDSSVERGRPSDFKLTGVITCWTEALQRMTVGGKARITCP